MSVYSPVDGFVDRIDFSDEEYYVMYLYNTRTSNHVVHIPMDGILSKPMLKNGYIEDSIFKQDSAAEMKWSIRPIQYMSPAAQMWFILQIDKSETIPDSVKLNIDVTNAAYYENAHIVQLGEILLFGRCIIILPKKYYVLNSDIKVFNHYSPEQIENIRETQQRDNITVGNTVLATLRLEV